MCEEPQDGHDDVQGKPEAAAAAPPAVIDREAKLLPMAVGALDADDPLAAVDDGSDRPGTLRVPVIEIVHGHEQFKMPDGEMVSFFVGRIIDTHPCNALWLPGDDEDRNRPPDCSSPDGKMPRLDVEGGPQCETCADCPHNKFGSAVDEKGVATRGKLCKNMRRIHVFVAGNKLPLRLTLTPTSIGAWDEYYPALANTGQTCYGVSTEFSLLHRDRGNQTWSTVQMQLAQDQPALTLEDKTDLAGFILSARPMLRAQAITLGEFVGETSNTDAQAAADAPVAGVGGDDFTDAEGKDKY